jgi:hypothetical protein
LRHNDTSRHKIMWFKTLGEDMMACPVTMAQYRTKWPKRDHGFPIIDS